uniref:Uncharacterized protein n=1 Tax=Lactuca sativa TaxID=4236 RepID=A0A9R1VT67_LACSA|nr:hypothetical protein LSAT_V11C400187670 [Lactuca sativa]
MMVNLVNQRTLYQIDQLKEELEGLTSNYPNRFKVYYVLNPVGPGFVFVKPPEGWTSGVGFILRCGPPPMNKAMAAHLEALGHESDMLFQF